MVRESDIVCHVVVLYSVDWTKAGISFIFLKFCKSVS